jgi:3-hydroxyisobutyrate dehydrogenase
LSEGRARIGFVGLGNLGGRLAACLVRAGHDVTVHDRDPATAPALLDAGATWSGSVLELARSSDTVITCLPSAAAVAAVVDGPEGVLAGLRRGGTWVDTSTSDRLLTGRLARSAQQSGVAVLEAPVTGGVHLAATGDLTVIVGGDQDVFGRTGRRCRRSAGASSTSGRSGARRRSRSSRTCSPSSISSPPARR